MAPTVHGNLLLGPTAIDIDDKEGTNTTREGLDQVIAKAEMNVKNIPLRQVITSFAGLLTLFNLFHNLIHIGVEIVLQINDCPTEICKR